MKRGHGISGMGAMIGTFFNIFSLYNRPVTGFHNWMMYKGARAAGIERFDRGCNQSNHSSNFDKQKYILKCKQKTLIALDTLK